MNRRGTASIEMEDLEALIENRHRENATVGAEDQLPGRPARLQLVLDLPAGHSPHSHHAVHPGGRQMRAIGRKCGIRFAGTMVRLDGDPPFRQRPHHDRSVATGRGEPRAVSAEGQRRDIGGPLEITADLRAGLQAPQADDAVPRSTRHPAVAGHRDRGEAGFVPPQPDEPRHPGERVRNPCPVRYDAPRVLFERERPYHPHEPASRVVLFYLLDTCLHERRDQLTTSVGPRPLRPEPLSGRDYSAGGDGGEHERRGRERRAVPLYGFAQAVRRAGRSGNDRVVREVTPDVGGKFGSRGVAPGGIFLQRACGDPFQIAAQPADQRP